MPRLTPILVVTLAALTACSLAQTTRATNSPTPLSTRVVAYTLDAHIDPDKHSLDATETLTYRNLTGQPLATFPFHLYLNAFQPESTFTSETHFNGGIRDSESEDDYPDRKRGSIVIAQLSAEGYGDLTTLLHFIAPDDGNANDRTVAQLTLPRALAPGDAITFHLRFRDQFPESIARNGYKRDFLMGGQWYPKLGVFWHGSWNCHQYHATTEFFSDFATFNVALTVPRRFLLGASGIPTGERSNPDGTHTLSFFGEDIHDFAWAASPNFYATDGAFQSSLGPVHVHVLALHTHPDAGQRYLKILLASLQQFDRRFGPYPYKILTLIDPEPGSEIAGMEYPTLITGGTSLLDPTLVTEETAEHEFGHQYWYGMVATNEFEDAWLDEGINSYTEVNVVAAILGPRTSFFSKPWGNLSDASQQYISYASKPDFDPVTRHAWQFRDAASYGGITYGKSATLLKTLEGLIGADTMDEAMRTYFMRFRFQHPTTEDFLRTIEEVALRRGRATGISTPAPPSHQSVGTSSRSRLTTHDTSLDPYHVIVELQPGSTASPQDPFPGTLSGATYPEAFLYTSLRPFFNQAVYGTAILDYAVDSTSSDPVKWWLPDTRQITFRDTVTLHRIGDFLLPVTLEVTFTDGTRRREIWDPIRNPDHNDRWHTFTYTTAAKIASAEIDPDHTVLLDLNPFNNSYTVIANPIPARKLTHLWLTAQQLAGQLASWLI